MSLTRWNQGNDLLSLTEDMSRFVNRVLGPANGEHGLTGSWMPAVDISEDKDNFYLRFELPGMTRENVKVAFEQGTLTVSGEKSRDEEREGRNYHRVERSYGRFERSFTVPRRIVPEKIDAKFKDGILTVTMAKAEEVKPKEIEVKVS